MTSSPESDVRPLQLVVRPRQSGLPQRLTYKLIEEGVLPAMRSGNSFLIPIASLREFVEKRAAQETRERAKKRAKRATAPEEAPA